MQNMESPSINNPLNDDTCASADDPLLDVESAATSQERQSQRRHHQRSPTVLVLVAVGLLAMIILALSTKSHDSKDRCALAEETIPIDPGKAAGVSSKIFRPVNGSTPYKWTTEMLNWQRSAFHFQPQENWMNDPNGPVLYKGWYHFFYQYNPFGAIWGHIVWGHAMSKDLIHWRHLPIAMVPDHWYDTNGVWTGSATILDNGDLVMLYTGSTNESVQVQCLAYPANSSDPFLIDWVKYSGNPVLVPPPGIGPKDFRDPTTAWKTPEGKWRITIGSMINKTGLSLVYDTEDFKTYRLQSELLHAVPGTGMWECVDFYPVSTTENRGLDTSEDGPNVKHVVKTSLDDEKNDYYTLGTYHGNSGTWKPDDPVIDVGIGLRYDYGTFYASKTFYDQDHKRRILWGWIMERDSQSTDVKKGWSSVQAIPRTILFDHKTKRNILQWPVAEVERLREDVKVFDNVEAKPGSVVPLDVGSSTSQLDIIADFEIEKYKSKQSNGDKVAYNCSASGGAAQRGALGPFGLLIHSNKDQSEQTPVYFYVYKNKKGDYKTVFCSDQSRSSEATDVDKAIYGSSVTVLKDEKLSMRILVDHSIVESFAQGGRTCITSRVYPTKTSNGNSRIFLFNNATDAKVTATLKIWKMNYDSFSYGHKHSVSFVTYLLPIFCYFVLRVVVESP